jgi:septal ring factor EnvC (AmiA/AmiB activator)
MGEIGEVVSAYSLAGALAERIEELESQLATAQQRIEALEAALADVAQSMASAHAWLKSPRMGGEHVPKAIAELEKRMAAHAALDGK